MFKQFVLTCVESKEFREKGETLHKYGGLGYVIVADEHGQPKVARIVPLDSVEYEIIVRR